MDGSSFAFEPVREGLAVLSVDITERKRAELARERTARALRTLSRSNQILVRAENETQFLQDVCRLVVEEHAYLSAWIELQGSEGTSPREVARAQSNPSGSDIQCSSQHSFPVTIDKTTAGNLTIGTAESATIGEEERKLLQEIALDIGYGIQTLRARVRHAETEGQLIAAQRLEAVGRLAGGIAHDFNNLLSVILSYAGFAMEMLHPADPVREDIEQVREAGTRASTLTKQLLAFSRKQLMDPRVTSINDVVSGIEAMLRRLLGEDIEINVHAAQDLGNVVADPGQLEQVLMNLAVNARDAMPSGGKLTIETQNVELDEEYSAGHLSVSPGPYILLSVTDTGMGMSAETRDRIFEPFFTTKESHGTGLGLSMVYGIVKQSGGSIWVYSEEGHGTTFKIYLPRVNAPLATPKPSRNTTATPRGSETVLLVEDEQLVRRAAERILRGAGYKVLAASNGGEALLLCEQSGGKIELLVTDVVMPNMNGQELADRLRQLQPKLKVLFTSGYTANAIVHHGVAESGARFLSKPFSAAELTGKVREALDED